MRKDRSYSHPMGLHHFSRSWETQRRPYRAALPYQTTIGTSNDPEVLTSQVTPWFVDALFTEGSAFEQRVLQKLWGKLQEEVGPKAENLTAMMELQSTIDMVDHRVRPLIVAANHLRKGNLNAFRKTLSVPPGKHRFSGRQTRRQASGAWLEAWLGWLPAMGDIYATIEAFDSNPHFDKIRVGTSGTLKRQTFNQVESQWENRQSVDRKLALKAGMMLRPWNQDVVLASSLGLTNPFLTAWDLVPLSFVWNWFNPVSAWLSQFSTFDGYRVWDQYLTKHVVSSGSYYIRFYGIQPSGEYGWGNWRGTTGWGLFSRRELGSIPYFKFPPVSPPRLNVTRALTSIALLQGHLKSF